MTSRRTTILPLLKSDYVSIPACVLAVILLCLAQRLQGQDIEKLKDEKLLRVNGGVNATSTIYEAIGLEGQRDPFFWQVGANLNLDFLGVVSAPFSVVLTSQNKNFSQPQPFNQFGISPKYRWITAHLGHRSMRFSDYSLAGNLFFGAGVELEHPNSPVQVSMMYGRFAKPVETTAQAGLVFAKPTFRRIGYGTKIQFGKEQQNIAFIFFKSEDDPFSINGDTLVEVRPEENLITAITFEQRIIQKFSISGEYAYSLFTRDMLAPDAVIDDFTFVNNLGSLFNANSSSQFNKAINMKVGYSADVFDLSLAYRRVDPEYKTHGSSFLTNDLEDISGGVNWGMFKKKVNFGTNIGVQRNNLDNTQLSRVRRLIWSLSSSITASEKLNINLAYSNFNSNTRQTQILDVISDSLSYFQVTRSGNVGINYTTQSTAQHGLFTTFNYQNADDSQSNTSNFYSGSVGHQFRLLAAVNVSSSYIINRTVAVGSENFVQGPNLTLSKPVLKGKGRLNLSSGILNSSNNGVRESLITNLRTNFSMRVLKKQNISSGFNYQRRNIFGEQARTTSEFRFNIGYNYAF